MKSKYPLNWNLQILFKDDSDPKIDEELQNIEKTVNNFVKKWKNNKEYLKDTKVLRKALDEYEKFFAETGLDGKAGFYIWLRTSIDQNNPKIKAKFNRIDELGRRLANELSFFSHRISKIPQSKHKIFLESPDLKPYRHYLFKLFEEGKYLLSEEEERILTLKSKTSGYNWVKLTSSLLAKEEAKVLTENGKKEIKNFSEILGMMDSKNKQVRDSAAKAFNEILKKWDDVAEAEINSVLESKKVNDTLRKIDRPDRLRHISEDIETEVVDTMLRSVTDRFDLGRRYYDLKAKLLQVKYLDYHERNLEIGKVSKEYTYDEAVDLVSKVFKRLDPEFNEIFLNLVDGYIDVYPKKGKASGAFCASDIKSHPVYILLNHTNKLNDVLTLAHEVGHGIHFQLSKAQNSLNFGATLSTAEVASTFMEDFVLEEILRDADDELKLNILMMKLNDDISTILRQVAIYNFERDLHEEFNKNGYLSKEEIGGLFLKNMAAYMGDSVKLNRGSENWWIYVSHIRNFFYVFSYANGLLISKSLQESVKEDPKFISKVKEFFKSGKSESTKDIFMKLGIDISDKEFWDNGLERIENLLSETENLAMRLGKI